MTARATGARFRQRKLSTKQSLAVVREHEVETLAVDDDPGRNVPHVETGVEKAEEIEHHLQAVISASAAASLGGKVAQLFIPTPETKSSNVQYDKLYPKIFADPQTYIRFSSTVEDCVGCPYCMNEADDEFLQALNQSRSQANGNGGKDGDARCTEDQFEEVMSFFDETSQTRQPFAAVDNPPVVSLEDMEASCDDTISLDARIWIKDIYPHWQTLRLETGNRPLMPALKIETGQETDDADAYVCFRRREVRQARKTRGRDAQVVEKLKKLRREVEEARQLVRFVVKRERLTRERIETERKVFEQRSELKRVKIQQGIKGDKGDDEDLLVNQRPIAKPKPKSDAAQQRPPTLRLSTSRPEGRLAENDLIQLSDIHEETAAMIQRSVEAKIGQHSDWNTGWLDQTWHPITPPLDTARMSGYLPIVEEVQLPTPPPSVRSESIDERGKDVEMKDADLPTPVSDPDPPHKSVFRFCASAPVPFVQDRPAYRRRFGRGGRLHIDEVRPRRDSFIIEEGVVYDSDGDSDNEPVIYPVDRYDNYSLTYRAALINPRARADRNTEQSLRRTSSIPSNDVSMTNGQATAGQRQEGSTQAGG